MCMRGCGSQLYGNRPDRSNRGWKQVPHAVDAVRNRLSKPARGSAWKLCAQYRQSRYQRYWDRSSANAQPFREFFILGYTSCGVPCYPWPHRNSCHRLSVYSIIDSCSKNFGREAEHESICYVEDALISIVECRSEEDRSAFLIASLLDHAESQRQDIDPLRPHFRHFRLKQE